MKPTRQKPPNGLLAINVMCPDYKSPLMALIACSAALAVMPAALCSTPAINSKRPNILFIIFDDWGPGTHAGANGCTWINTPNFDRVAREGVLFKNAFTSNPKCSPCRASILTGRNTWQLKEAVSHFGMFPEGLEVYPDLLEKTGYVVGLTGKGWGPGDFKTLAKRARNPAGPSFEGKIQARIATGINSKDYVANFEAFLQQRPPGKPFCFWMGFHEPHRAYERGSGLRLGKNLAAVRVPVYLPDNDVVRGDLLDYAVEVEWGDKQVGRALEVLETAGELGDTLVIVTSDNGMPFPYAKGEIHEDAFHLPLAMCWHKGIVPGRIVEDFVNVRDFAPTFMELAGLDPHPQMTGTSLVNILRSPNSGWVENRDVMLVGKERHDVGRPNDVGYPVRAIRTRDFLYVHNFFPDRWPACDPESDFDNVDPSPTKKVIQHLGGYYFELSLGKRPPDELYRLTDDPESVRNLAHDLAFTETMLELRSKMMTLLRDEHDPRALGEGAIFDTYKWTGGRAKAYGTWLQSQESAINETLSAPRKPDAGLVRPE